MKAADLFSMLKEQQAAMVAALQSAGISAQSIEEALSKAGLSSRQIQERVEKQYPGSVREVWESRVNTAPETQQLHDLVVELLKRVPVPQDHYVLYIPGSGWRCRPLAAQRQQQPRRQHQPQPQTTDDSDPGPYHKVGASLVARDGDQFLVKLPDGSKAACAASSTALHSLLREKGVIGGKTRYALPPGLRG